MKKNEQKVDDRAKEKTKPKKKRGCGCGCAIASLSIFLIIVIGGLCVGGFFADEYLKDNFGIGVFDALGLVGDVSSPNRAEIVNNATTEDDEQTLYQSFDEKLLFKNGTFTEQRMDDILNELFQLDAGTSQPLTGGGGSGLPMAIENLLSRDNIDFDKVKQKFVDGYDYESNYENDFVISLSDRQLKILVERMLEANLEQIEDGLNGILDKLTFEQLKMTRQDDMPKMSITIRLDVDAFLDAYMPPDMNFFASVAKVFIPDELYIVLDATLGDSQNVYSFRFNSMGDDAQKKMYQLIAGILEMTGQEQTDPNAFIYDIIDPALSDFISVASGWIDIKNVTEDGYVKLDFFKLVADGVASDMNAVEFVKLYTSVLRADADVMIKQYQDDLFKEMTDGENPIYSAQKVQQEFMDEFHNKYLLHEDFYLDADAPEHTQKIYFSPTEFEIENLGLTHYKLDFYDIGALFGVGESELINNLATYGVDIKSIIDTKGFMKALNGQETDDRNEWFINADRAGLEFIFTDKMLAALIDSQLDSFLGGLQGFDGLALEFIKIDKGEDELVNKEFVINSVSADTEVPINRIFVELGFTAKTAGFVGANGLLSKVLPDTIGFVIRLDVTPSLAIDALTPYEMNYCDLSASLTGDILTTLKKLNIELLSDAQIKDALLTPIREMFSSIKQMLGEITVEDGKIVLSDIFEVISLQGFNGDITADEVKGVLAQMIDVPAVEKVANKDYLKDSLTEDELSLGITGCANVFYGLNNDRENTDKFNDNFIKKVNDIFGYELDGKIGKAVGYSNEEGERYMYFTFEYDLSQYLYEQDMCLLPIKTVYATFKIDKQDEYVESGIRAYRTEFFINGMTESEMITLEQILSEGNESNAGDFAVLAHEVGAFGYLLNNNKDLLEPMPNLTT